MNRSIFLHPLAFLAPLFFVSLAPAAVLFSEPFTYPDGPLLSQTNSPWVYSSGIPNNALNVTNSAANLTGAEAEDLGRSLPGGPFTTGTLYASFDVTFSALPSATGFYFSQFTNTPTGLTYRTRLWAQTANAADGSFRLGLTDATSTASAVAQLPLDLSLDTTYRLVEALDLSTGRSTLYLSPTSDLPSSARATVTATDTTTTTSIGAFRLTQNTGIGTLRLDNLTVSTTFAEAVPEPTALALLPLVALTLTRRR